MSTLIWNLLITGSNELINREQNTYHHKDLRSALIEAAIGLLPASGASGLSLREVAKAAGVSHTAPYRHFKDKSALLAAIAQTGFERLSDAITTVVAAHDNDPQQQLVEAGSAYVTLGLQNPDMMHLMFGGVLDPDTLSEEFCNTSMKSFAGLVHIIEAGQKAGIFKADPPESIAITAWSMVHGLMMLIAAGHLRDMATLPEQAEQLSRIIGHNLLTGILK